MPFAESIGTRWNQTGQTKARAQSDWSSHRSGAWERRQIGCLDSYAASAADAVVEREFDTQAAAGFDLDAKRLLMIGK